MTAQMTAQTHDRTQERTQDRPQETGDAPQADASQADRPSQTQLLATPQTRVLRSGDRLLVRRGDEVSVIEGADGVALIEQLLTAATGSTGGLPLPEASGDEEERLLDDFARLLTESGLARSIDAGPVDDPTLRTLWMRSGEERSLQELADARDAAVVGLFGRGPLAERIGDALAEASLTTRRGDGVAEDDSFARLDFAVVVADHQDHPDLVTANRLALDSGTPWLPVVADDGLRTLVGPLIHPDSSACWECVRLRRAANFPDRELSAELAGATAVAGPSTLATTLGTDLVVAGLTVEKTVDRVLLGDHAQISRPGSMAVVRPTAPGLGIEEHLVLRVPRCTACSPATGRGEPQVWFHGGTR